MERTPYATILEWQAAAASNLTTDHFIVRMPKIELHIHLEGTMSSTLRWKLGQRNQIPIHNYTKTETYTTLNSLQAAYHLNDPNQPRSTTGAKKTSAFFEAYYGAMDVLRTEQDFYDLAMEYFSGFDAIHGRYAELFFDPQAHTRRGISWEVFMSGLERAKRDAEENFGIQSNYIMCILRDLPLASAKTHYEACLPYRHLIRGIGLDGNEYDNPPLLFQEVFTRARNDGFKITAHCDVTQKNTHEHIRQVACDLGGGGADRVDHGLDVADDEELLEMARDRRLLFTICPWAYVRHISGDKLFADVRKVVDSGLRICISSDSPAYMEEQRLCENLSLVRIKCGFSDGQMADFQRNAVLGCWASEDIKSRLLEELSAYERQFVL